MRPTSRILLGCLLGGFLAAGLPATAQDVQIIAHPDSEVTSVTRVELSRMYLKRLHTWQDGTTVVPVDQVPENPVRRDFTRWIHRRSVVNIEVYWKRMIFSGRDVPPAEVGDDDAVVRFVRDTPGAVGYVRKSARIEGVRRLEVLD